MQQGSVCSTLTPSSALLLPLSSAIAVSVATSNATTLNDKQTDSPQSTRKPKSSKTSGAGSTSNVGACLPYWDDSCVERSSKLWLPTVTDLQVSASMQFDSSSKQMVENSWFSTHTWKPAKKPSSQPIFSPSFTTSAAECTDTEVTLRAKRIRIYPTPAQKNLFRRWFGTSRKVYNLTVEHLNQPKELRQTHWMGAAKLILQALPDWAKEIPYQVKKIAVEDAYKAFSNGCRKAKKTGKAFNLSFRSAKKPKQSCFIPSSALRDSGIYPRISGELKMAEKFPDEARDSRLVFEHGRWFVIVPYRVATTKADNQGRIVALDPGVRTFMTGYAEDGAFKIGDGDFARIARLGRNMDDLISRMSKAKAKQKRRMKKALSRMKFKVWDLIDELHFKTIRFLLSNYDAVLLPTFETSKMVARSNRKIRSKTVRAMLAFSFHKFGMRLASKAAEFGKIVVRTNEAYTSKTASWTGEIKQIGAAKKITSNGITVDRDLNGARGIFLRALVDTPSLFQERAFVSVQ